MNGATFYCWFEANKKMAHERHLGEFSDAELAARRVTTKRSVMARLAAFVIGLTERRAILPTAPARSV